MLLLIRYKEPQFTHSANGNKICTWRDQVPNGLSAVSPGGALRYGVALMLQRGLEQPRSAFFGTLMPLLYQRGGAPFPP